MRTSVVSGKPHEAGDVGGLGRPATSPEPVRRVQTAVNAHRPIAVRPQASQGTYRCAGRSDSPMPEPAHGCNDVSVLPSDPRAASAMPGLAGYVEDDLYASLAGSNTPS